MRVSQQGATMREALNIRIKPEVRELIDRAAELVGKNRADFVLDAVRRAAEDTLLDRAVFTVSVAQAADTIGIRRIVVHVLKR